MSYKIIMLADLHLQDNESLGGRENSDICFRTRDKLMALAKVKDFANDNRVDSVIIAGDLFNGVHISNNLRLEVSKILSKIDCPIYILGGNHDTTNNKVFNFMPESNYASNLHFAKNLSIKTNEGIALKLLSWGQEYIIDQMVVINPTILISHLSIMGGKYENERVSDELLHPALLRQFLAVFSGHFHKRQKKDNWRYVGALCRNNFGERNNPDGFLYLCLQDGKIIREEYITINDRKFYQYEFDILSEEDIYEKIDSITLEENIVKINFNVLSDFHLHRRKIKEYAKRKNPFHIAIEYERTKQPSSQKIKKDLTQQEMFLKYTEIKKVPNYLRKIGEDIMNKNKEVL